MATRVNMIEEYADASIEKKVEIILDNYEGFCALVDGYEKCLSIQIRTEREYNRKGSSGDLGIRVQTSGLSDTTARIAIENVSIQEAIKSGDYESALKGADNIEKHKKEIRTLINMRDDYIIVSNQIHVLQGKELRLFKVFLSGEKELQELATEEGMCYNAIWKKIRKSRNAVTAHSLSFLESKYKYMI